MPDSELTMIHRYVPAPGPGDGRTLLLLHGTGGNENDLLPLGRELAPGAALLGVRGKVLEHGMPRFFRRLAEGVFDLEDLQHRTHELADFIAAATDAYGIDPARLAAVGYSNGANIAASLLLLRPGTLATAVLFRPMVPLVPDQLPDLDGTRVFIAAGRQDPIVPAEQSEALAGLLQRAGARVTLHWEEASHGLTRPELRLAREWLHKE